MSNRKTEKKQKKHESERVKQFSHSMNEEMHVNVERLKEAHRHLLASLWLEYRDPMLASAAMHAVHAAMFEFEKSFIEWGMKEMERVESEDEK